MLPLVRRVIYGDDVSDEELEIAFSQVVSMVPHRLLPSVSVTIQDINAMSLRELKGLARGMHGSQASSDPGNEPAGTKSAASKAPDTDR